MTEFFNIHDLELTGIIFILVISALVISIAGTYLAKFADQIADITKLGEALVGAVLLGAVTSLAGVVTSISAALQGYADLAISNAIGGIAVQTFFLAIADMTYRKANLEHASASLANLMYSVLLIGLLTTLLMMSQMPEVTFQGFHPGSPIIIITYVAGLWMVSKSSKKPMWSPTHTVETVADVPAKDLHKINLKRLWLGFIVTAGLVIVAGYFVGEAGIAISERTRLSETFVGGLFTAVATSLPELIVSISAVKRGSLTMAVSNIVGGNSFEVIVVALADFFYKGSILHAATSADSYIITLTILLMSVLLMGLLYREKQGIGKIGWESLGIIIIFIVGYLILFFSG
ncbi:cation:H+ antiporter [Aquiflexum balticum DSM 16537]|uniref:Cation:H+ antiporter n=1 Tax=Aquiflexum balticum DSM 16537 TaxID=758820 RepID=A0A1W2GZP9_9BACT|nr:cation transporter [Aquiflexum balticum]SMD42129.1 cation:H+ antiporter [Aquiflexum balticum DSM 16537]